MVLHATRTLMVVSLLFAAASGRARLGVQTRNLSNVGLYDGFPITMYKEDRPVTDLVWTDLDPAIHKKYQKPHTKKARPSTKELIQARQEEVVAGAFSGWGAAIVNGIAFAIAAYAVAQALQGVVKKLEQMQRSWDEARQIYNCGNVKILSMSSNLGAATVCVNVDYYVNDTSKILNKTTNMFHRYLVLKCTYDCFYLKGPSFFQLMGDGGYQNICVVPAGCTYDSGTMPCPDWVGNTPDPYAPPAPPSPHIGNGVMNQDLPGNKTPLAGGPPNPPYAPPPPNTPSSPGPPGPSGPPINATIHHKGGNSGPGPTSSKIQVHPGAHPAAHPVAHPPVPHAPHVPPDTPGAPLRAHPPGKGFANLERLSRSARK